MADHLSQTICAEVVGGTAALAKLTNDAGGSTVDTVVLGNLMDEAEAIIYAHLGKGWEKPVTAATHGADAVVAVLGWCKRAFKYLALYRRQIVDEQVANDFTQAKKEALQAARGGLALPGDPPPTRTSPEAARVYHDNPEEYDATERDANCPARRWTRESQG